MADENIDPLKHILECNSQWASGALKLSEPDFFDSAGIPPQEPHTLWIGCADSRVPESVIAGGAPPGTIFVHRNIANQLHLDDDNALSVLQYGIAKEHLRIPNVVIVGHTHCGGVAAALGGSDHPLHLHTGSHPAHETTLDPVTHWPIPWPRHPSDPLTRWLAPLTALANELFPPPRPPHDEALLRLVEANVRAQVDNLAQTKSVLEAWREFDDGEDRPAVWLHGWVYDLETKKLRDLHISRGPPGAKPRQ